MVEFDADLIFYIPISYVNLDLILNDKNTLEYQEYHYFFLIKSIKIAFT